MECVKILREYPIKWYDSVFDPQCLFLLEIIQTLFVLDINSCWTHLPLCHRCSGILACSLCYGNQGLRQPFHNENNSSGKRS